MARDKYFFSHHINLCCGDNCVSLGVVKYIEQENAVHCHGLGLWFIHFLFYFVGSLFICQF